MPYAPFRTGDPKIDRNLDAIAQQLNALLALGLGQPPAWTPLQLSAGLVNATGAVETIPAQFTKDALGTVWGVGSIQNTSGATLATGYVFATLPAGYRPAKRSAYVVRQTNATSQVFPIDIEANGDLVLLADLTNTSFLGLDFAFKAEV